ncbi:molybdopterin-dependent oxidoreductase [Leptolyngbya sp. DQ-M1]|uniref:molybdopterin-dependent oxidoreductase n=1 Tax=Leptolyngbya sp. DQ-M1 TaxID=2933920 RepID=UPI00329796E9
MSNWHPTACILCSRNCGLLVQVEAGHLVKIRGDQNHPISAGYLCQKAAQLDHYQNHVDRLHQPLRRTPDGRFEPISWDTAIAEIADRLIALRDAHGTDCLAYYGGGGQGNHLGAMYSSAFRQAMGIRYYYSALAQEKTGDFWINGKLFGRQSCHITEDIEHTDCAIIIGTNPWQSHGIRNARRTLKQIAKDPSRTLIVIDPRRTETAQLADIHLQLRPGTDAFLLAAMLATIVREGLENRQFLQQHTVGFSELREVLLQVPIDEYIAQTGLAPEQVFETVQRLTRAKSACVRVDLGLQQSRNSTLNSYLEKLLFLLTGNLGKRGGNTFHSFFLPIVGHSEPKGKARSLLKTAVTGVAEIAELFPPNVLPAEIDTDHPQRTRALIVDSANPIVSAADTQAYRQAFEKLELLVVIDVAMTETARYAHYILPAPSQFEKWEASFFTLDFPKNGFHLRKPLFAPQSDTLPEPEIYRRLGIAAGVVPTSFPLLTAAARLHRRFPNLGIYYYALISAISLRPKLNQIVPFVLQGSLGKTLPDGADAAAPFWGASHLYVRQHSAAVARTGLKGRGKALAEALFERIMTSPSGTVLSHHRYEDTWSFIHHRDGRVHLLIPGMIEALQALPNQSDATSEDYPLILIAGERRAYNANTIYRDPAWRKEDSDGALHIHPSDAARFGLEEGTIATCESSRGSIQVRVQISDQLRPGVVSLPHGYGLDYPDATGQRTSHGPLINLLTDAKHCDPISATPFHKYVPVRLKPASP